MLTCECFEICDFNGLQPRNQGNGHPMIAVPADRSWMTEALTFGGRLLVTAQCAFRGCSAPIGTETPLGSGLSL